MKMLEFWFNHRGRRWDGHCEVIPKDMVKLNIVPTLSFTGEPIVLLSDRLVRPTYTYDVTIQRNKGP